MRCIRRIMRSLKMAKMSRLLHYFRKCHSRGSAVPHSRQYKRRPPARSQQPVYSTSRTQKQQPRRCRSPWPLLTSLSHTAAKSDNSCHRRQLPTRLCSDPTQPGCRDLSSSLSTVRLGPCARLVHDSPWASRRPYDRTARSLVPP